MINSTLIAQIIHFFIAWWLLRRFLWPQLLAAYEAHVNKQLVLEQHVQNAQLRVQQQKERLAADWKAVRRTCRRMLAPIKERPSVLAVHPLELPQPLAPDTLLPLADATAAIVAKKVLDA